MAELYSLYVNYSSINKVFKNKKQFREERIVLLSDGAGKIRYP